MATQEVCFSVLARHLLDPQSDLSKKYPNLHEILQYRLEIAYASRNFSNISRCDHDVFNGFGLGRTDEITFQTEENSAQIDFLNPISNDNTSSRVNSICELLANHVEIYGLLGCGTFGAVYLARERQRPSFDPNWPISRHYAVKVDRHITLAGGTGVFPVPVAPIYDNAELARFIPTEALYLLFLSRSDRFPKLESVYSHDRFQSIVMSACVDPSLDRQIVQSGDYVSRFPAFVGRYLMSPDHTPLLDEMATCKVAAQLLEGIIDMAQINLFHCDLSMNNFIVDPQLNVQLIDLGYVFFGLEDSDFYDERYAYLPFQEYQMMPKLVEVVSRPENESRDWEEDPWVKMPNDVRRTLIWKYGVIIYGLLHGNWPWEDLSIGDSADLLDYNGVIDDRITDRRRRILSEDLAINEHLSQDCKDVLQGLFQKDPTKRPSLETLISYPWFTQWRNQNRVYERPFSKKFQDSYSRRI